MFHFGFRVVEILEQDWDKFGTGFWGSYYAWADLKSIWYGRGACELTYSATQKGPPQTRILELDLQKFIRLTAQEELRQQKKLRQNLSQPETEK